MRRKPLTKDELLLRWSPQYRAVAVRLLLEIKEARSFQTALTDAAITLCGQYEISMSDAKSRLSSYYWTFFRSEELKPIAVCTKCGQRRRTRAKEPKCTQCREPMGVLQHV